MHAKAHDGPDETRAGVRIARGLALRCARLGLIGVADIVEFHASPSSGERQPFPVEYKRGKPKSHDADVVQLCAQALSLEEMLGIPVPAGALFYGETRRRLDVLFDVSLRRLTEASAARLHELIGAGRTPRAIRERKCESCSLLSICMPDPRVASREAERYVTAALARSLSDPSTEDGAT